ncbi:MAG: ethylbenzene dehydrogenase-related protein, partial [Caldilinea sp.]
MKKLFTVLTLLVMAALLVACGGSAPAVSQPAPAADAGAAPAAAPASAPNTLTAIKVDATSLDLNADYWSKAPVLSIDTKAAKEGNPDGPTVMLQAVYDGDTIAIRGEWADPTESLKNAWQWDGTAFSKVKGDEDRLMLVFPIQNNAEFASKGCAAACHNTAE